MKPLKQGNACSVDKLGIDKRSTCEGTGLVNMKLDLKVVRLNRIATLKTQRLRIPDGNVVERFDLCQFISDVANFAMGLEETTCLKPEKSGLIVVSLHAW